MKEPKLVVLPDWLVRLSGLWPVGCLTFYFLPRSLSFVLFAKGFMNKVSGLRLLHCWLHELSHSSQLRGLKGEAAEWAAEQQAVKSLLARGVTAEAIVNDELEFRFAMKFGVGFQKYKAMAEGLG